MPVYVDQPKMNAHDTRIPSCFSGWQSCHMYADTLEELHAMADKLDMRRSWFQDKPTLQHYDLVLSKRAQAIELGAVQHNAREAVAKWRDLRVLREMREAQEKAGQGKLW